MDRDSNWKRLQPAYDLLTLAKGTKEKILPKRFQMLQARTRNDYYIDPIVIGEDSTIKNEDSVIFEL